MANEDVARDGGCLCGAVRYRTEGAPKWVLTCHCNSCRRGAGAPLVTWVGFEKDRFAWSKGEAGMYASSPGVERHFCGVCGTPMVFRSERWPSETHITAVSLDDPESVAPTAHVHTADKLDWMHVSDGLPQHAATSGGA